uniref:Uncharacterized protein n=1 Tax=Spermophilus dauricus TaxID=99837 RepID=A0A8C9NZX4_SPEDA
MGECPNLQVKPTVLGTWPLKTVGFMPDPLCKNTVNSTDILSSTPNVTYGAFPLPWGALWICGSNGWPYLPYHWTGRCTWGWPYIPARVRPLLPQMPRVGFCWPGYHLPSRASSRSLPISLPPSLPPSLSPVGSLAW